jgi:hypothetical protein
MLPLEAQPNGKLPVFAPGYNGNGASSPQKSRRNSDLPVFANGNGTSNGVKSTRRSSDVRSVASPRPSDVSGRVSPESMRRQTMVNFPTSRTNGAVSPLTVRSISPVGWRSGAVSPIAQRSSSPGPGQTYRSSPLSNGTNTPQASGPGPTIAAQKAAARKSMGGLTLDTQLNRAPQQRPHTIAVDHNNGNGITAEEEDEMMDEVISLSPAVRAPVMKFRRSSTALSGKPSVRDEMSLDTVLEGEPMGRYFGQAVEAEDLVAVNLENAFDRL